MQTLKNHIKSYNDILRKHEITSFRFYTKKAQITLIKLIIEELRRNNIQALPEQLFQKLGAPEQLSSNDIKELCELYKETVLFCYNKKIKL